MRVLFGWETSGFLNQRTYFIFFSSCYSAGNQTSISMRLKVGGFIQRFGHGFRSARVVVPTLLGWIGLHLALCHNESLAEFPVHRGVTSAVGKSPMRLWKVSRFAISLSTLCI